MNLLKWETAAMIAAYISCIVCTIVVLCWSVLHYVFHVDVNLNLQFFSVQFGVSIIVWMAFLIINRLRWSK
jgi:hypothetical protein